MLLGRVAFPWATASLGWTSRRSHVERWPALGGDEKEERNVAKVDSTMLVRCDGVRVCWKS